MLKPIIADIIIGKKIKIFNSPNPGLMIKITPAKPRIKEIKIFLVIFSFKSKFANITKKKGSVSIKVVNIEREIYFNEIKAINGLAIAKMPLIKGIL
jgi:hypothetical protein